MIKLRQRVILGLSSLFGVTVLAATPVWAAHGLDSSSGGSDDSITTNSQTLREQAQELLQEKRQNHQNSTAEHKQKACEAHKAEIDRRSKNYATAAQRHLDVFNKIFTKVQAFHDSKKLNVSNYDELVAAAQAKQTAAQTAVDNLKDLDVSIDCTSSDPAATVAALKTAVKDARTALQDYRKSIKDLVVALKGASTSTDKNTSTDTSTSTGGDQ